MTTGVACRGIVVHDGKVLLTKTKVKDRDWTFPGGKLDDGELPEACVKREIREETGLDVDVGDIIYARLSDLRGKKGYNTDYAVVLYYKTEPKTFNIIPGPEDAVRWFTLDEIRNKLGHRDFFRTILMKAGFWKEVQTTL